jgi:ActR/RegA family two-component response regulator
VDLRLAHGEDGRQVIRRLSKRCPAMPVVVVTGFDPEAPEADLRGLGGPTLRLRKPFDCDHLASSVAAMLDAPPVPANQRRRAADVLSPV